MAKDRIEPCKFYICEGQCTKNRSASHKSYCQNVQDMFHVYEENTLMRRSVN